MTKRPKSRAARRAKADEWAAQINAEWRKQVPGIVKTGALLIEAKHDLGHGNWCVMVGDDKFGGGKLDFHLRVAEMLMRIAGHGALSNPKNFSYLPPVYSTLHQLSAIPPEQLQQLIDDRTVHPQLKGSEAKTLRSGHLLVEELPKTLLSLAHFVRQCASKLDDDTLGKLTFQFSQHVGGSGGPAELKDWLLPRLGALLDQVQQHLDKYFSDPDKIIRDGKICFREPREIADPLADIHVRDKADA